MKVGDLVKRVVASTRNQHMIDELGVIVDVITHIESYASSGCKKYIIATAHGNEYRCWQGELEVINESR